MKSYQIRVDNPFERAVSFITWNYNGRVPGPTLRATEGDRVRVIFPIPIYQNQLTRLYVLNMIEFDTAATFHLHANFFEVYPTGMSLTPSKKTDVITMGTAERHILEFSYRFPGKYMFHPHQDAIAEAGCMGLFEVLRHRIPLINQHQYQVPLPVPQQQSLKIKPLAS